MCIAVPGQIKSITDKEAIVDILDIEASVNIQLIREPKVGDYVLIHAGCAIEKLEEGYSNDLSNIFRSLIEGESIKNAI